MTSETPREPDAEGAPVPRVRTRTRQLDLSERRPQRIPGERLVNPAPPPPEDGEGRFDYGESLSVSPAVRYRQIKSIEGTKAARSFAKEQILKLILSGVQPQEIAQVFGFSLTWTNMLATEAREDMRFRMTRDFNSLGIIAEHMTVYQTMRQMAFHSMNKTNATDIERWRARDSLLAIMRDEMNFIARVGGLRGVALTQGNGDDEAVTAARELSEELRGLAGLLGGLLQPGATADGGGDAGGDMGDGDPMGDMEDGDPVGDNEEEDPEAPTGTPAGPVVRQRLRR